MIEENSFIIQFVCTPIPRDERGLQQAEGEEGEAAADGYGDTDEATE